MISKVKAEPVLSASGVLAVLGALLGFATAHGWLSETQASGVTQLLAVVVPLVLPLVVGWVARKFVSPVKPPA